MTGESGVFLYSLGEAPLYSAAAVAAAGIEAAAVSAHITAAVPPTEPAQQEDEDDDGPQIVAAEETIVARHVIYLHTLAGHPALSHSIVLHAPYFGY